MTRTEMIDNLLDSYTKRELQALAERLGFGVNIIAKMPLNLLSSEISGMLFNPANKQPRIIEATKDKDGIWRA